jgi:DNA-binding MarR family transcriptional regulator
VESADSDHLAVQAFSEALWRVLEWGRKSIKTRTTTPTFEVLVALSRCKNFALSYDDLEAAIGRSRRMMQYVVSDMCTTGLLEIVPSPSDRRRRVIRLSTLGKNVIGGYRDMVLEEMEELSRLRTGSRKTSKQQLYGLRGLAIAGRD